MPSQHPYLLEQRRWVLQTADSALHGNNHCLCACVSECRKELVAHEVSNVGQHEQVKISNTATYCCRVNSCGLMSAAVGRIDTQSSLRVSAIKGWCTSRRSA